VCIVYVSQSVSKSWHLYYSCGNLAQSGTIIIIWPKLNIALQFMLHGGMDSGPAAGCKTHGFRFYLVTVKHHGHGPVCGLLKRTTEWRRIEYYHSPYTICSTLSAHVIRITNAEMPCVRIPLSDRCCASYPYVCYLDRVFNPGHKRNNLT